MGILSHVGARLSAPDPSNDSRCRLRVGEFCRGCRRRGLRAIGVEPDRIGQGAALTSIEIARRCVDEHVFALVVGEKLPFADACLDLETINQVMERVMDQKLVLREALRAVRPGAVVYIACPNYLRFYEPHYKSFWFPQLPKPLGRLYHRLRSRDPVSLDQLTYTTNSSLRRLDASVARGDTCVDFHGQAFLAKCRDASFARRWLRILAKSMQLSQLGGILLRTALAFARVTEGGCEVAIVRGLHPVDRSC